MKIAYEIVVVVLLSLQLFATCITSLSTGGVERKGYVVHLQPRDDDHHHGVASDPDESDILTWHRSFLPESVTTTTAAADSAEEHDGGPRLVYSYTHVFPGFAARLTDAEAAALQSNPGVMHLHPDRDLPLATTHSPDFLGLRLGAGAGFWNVSGFGKGVVVGLLDTGILPSHPSFTDEGVPPPPKKWKGACEFATACNNKIIGARSFGSAGLNATSPPFDDAGHGTHTASTAAGNFVKNANVRGVADGTAAGMAPHAHLAIYKVCSRSRCSIMDIIAGMDAAVKDGVDVLSFSIGAYSGPFNYDLIAISAFRAMERGIFVSCAAGNSGPAPGTVGNAAPWMLTVAAGTMDRAIRATVRLGNGEEFHGESLYQPSNFSSLPLPLVYPGGNNVTSSRQCGDMGGEDTRGKIVLCESSGLDSRLEQGSMVRGYGGAAMVLMNQQPEGYTTFADAHVLPASHVSYDAGSKILQYIKSTTNPTASIAFKGTVIGAAIPTTIAFFSSRGPGKSSPGILKPDITGPGMNILAAWAPSEMYPAGAVDAAAVTFNIESGTSMSTPHLSGIAALVKSVHPNWSPAAIKSAIMTTSDAADHTGVPIKDEQYRKASFLAMGAGYVNAPRAINPGLIYDIHASDYVSYLCGLGLGNDGVTSVAHRRTNCAIIKNISEAELNYPSLVVNSQTQAVTVRRTVTNVGKSRSVYRAVVDMPMEFSVTVQPPTLSFSKVNQKLTFAVTVAPRGGPVSSGAEGNLKWVSPDGYVVRSPILIPATS